MPRTRHTAARRSGRGFAPRRAARCAVVAVVLALLFGACDGSGDDATTAPEPTTPASEAVREDTEADATAPADDTTGADDASPDEPAGTDHGRVIAIGEEFLLSDLLSLGIVPVASTATVPDAGFLGIDPAAAEGIEILPMVGLGVEQVATLQPDTVVTLQFVVDQLGADVAAGLGELIIVPDGLSSEEQVTVLGELLDREAEADAVLGELDQARSDAATAIGDDCVVSLASVLPGPTVAAYVEAVGSLPQGVVDAGCTLDPGASDADADRNGRAFLSLEQLELLDAPTMVLLQSSAVEGEEAAVAEMTENPIWQSLPAVQADRVVVLDRLGYPGVSGQIRFLADLTAALSSDVG